jgi:hypothetical protein
LSGHSQGLSSSFFGKKELNHMDRMLRSEQQVMLKKHSVQIHGKCQTPFNRFADLPHQENPLNIEIHEHEKRTQTQNLDHPVRNWFGRQCKAV